MKPSDTEQHRARQPRTSDEIEGELRWWQRSVLKKEGIGMTILVLALGATLGAAVRYYATIWAATHFGTAFPYGTLLVNVVGSFILGGFLTLAAGRAAISPELRLLVATGFCGSLTTFSTFSYETAGMLDDRRFVVGALYALGSLALGLACVWLGAACARALGA